MRGKCKEKLDLKSNHSPIKSHFSLNLANGHKDKQTFIIIALINNKPELAQSY